MSGKRVFQSTLPRGERHPLINIHIIAHGFFGLFQILSSYFNPRSREGSDCRSLFRFSRSCDFNPRSREGSDVRNLTQHSGRIFISIHAPARGATQYSAAIRGTQKFQSTLPRGERRCRRRSVLYCSAFQSTLPRGERLTLARNFPCGVRKISIHAPARGATSEFICNFSSDIISIHAPARGATAVFFAFSAPASAFQSTLPRGERPRFPCRPQT